MNFKGPMKTLLRNARTGKFFRGNGRWTKRVDRALDFPHTMHVVHTCLLHGFKDVELVLHFGGQKPEKALSLKRPMTWERQRPAARLDWMLGSEC